MGLQIGPCLALVECMEQIKIKPSYKLQMVLALSIFSYTELSFHDSAQASHSPIFQADQKSHAKELFGHQKFNRSVKNVEYSSMTVMKIVHTHLPKEYKKDASKIAQAIINEAFRYQMDPMFLVAVILTESSFNPTAKGRHGEIGLMQILPETGEWLAKKSKFKGKIDLKNPETNIKLGAAYFASLRKNFDGVGHRYIAAYNMGSKNVHRLVASQVEPKIYSNKVMAHYLSLYRSVQ